MLASPTLAPSLIGDNGVAGGCHILWALVPVEDLKVLKRTAGFGRDQPLFHDAV